MRLLGAMSTVSVAESWRTARPKSAMAHWPLRLTRMFLLLRSLWAIAGLPVKERNCVIYLYIYIKLIWIVSQWAWFSMSSRNFIGSNQSSTHPLLDDGWIAHSAITQGSCVFNGHVHRISYDASVHQCYLGMWWTPCNDFGFLDWNIYFHEGCNFSNDSTEIM